MLITKHNMNLLFHNFFYYQDIPHHFMKYSRLIHYTLLKIWANLWEIQGTAYLIVVQWHQRFWPTLVQVTACFLTAQAITWTNADLSEVRYSDDQIT